MRYEADNPSTRRAAQAALLIGQLINSKFGRDAEPELDRPGVRFIGLTP